MNKDERPRNFEDAQYWVMTRSVESGPSDIIGLSHQYRSTEAAAKEAENYIQDFRRQYDDELHPDDTVHWNVIPVTEQEFHSVLQEEPPADPDALSQTWLGEDADTKEPPEQSLQATIELPACWKNLVEETFDEEDCPPKASNRSGYSDPNPYVDDHRILGTTLPDGKDLSITLASGNENYWGTVQVHDGDELVYQTEPFHDFSDTMPVHVPGGPDYQVDIDWASPHPDLQDYDVHARLTIPESVSMNRKGAAFEYIERAVNETKFFDDTMMEEDTEDSNEPGFVFSTFVTVESESEPEAKNQAQKLLENDLDSLPDDVRAESNLELTETVPVEETVQPQPEPKI